MNNIVFIDNNFYNEEIIVDNGSLKEIFYIDNFKNDLNFNLNIQLKNNAKIKIVFCSINFSSFTKKINIFVNHLANDSFANCNVFSINKDFSNTIINITNKIENISHDNECVQNIKGILLSSLAKIIGKPNLLIDTNNIKAKHSLAIGFLNPNYLYYLTSKSVSLKEAKKILIMSFFYEALNEITNEIEKEKMYQNIYNEIGEI